MTQYMKEKMESKKMTRKEKKMLNIIKIAGNVVLKEDINLLKELAKH